MLGETNPKDSAPGTIRGDFCIQVNGHFIPFIISRNSYFMAIAVR
jgi:nucleoside diphosphate kinase